MQIRLAADLQSDSVVDGPGLRAIVWTQGCAHHCKGCQNPCTWDFNAGALVEVSEVCKAISELKYHTGITFSGGDPMYQPKACNEIAKYAKSLGLDIWVYTGFTFEEIIEMSKKDNIYLEFLSNIDTLVDGRFILEKRNLGLLFRGSENQRLINVKETFKLGKIVTLNEHNYFEEESFKKQEMFI